MAEEEVGKGSKHSTAAKISKVTEAACIAVSVDGRITVYSEGKVLFKMMG
jgi:DNA integrity scanning protein DisA with diadenylate cyclase activity